MTIFNELNLYEVPDDIKELFSNDLDDNQKYYFMKEAIAEAKKSPMNFKVGCVIVNKDKIVGRGYRKPESERVVYHAEHLALLEAGKAAEGAILYCTVEPCIVRERAPEGVCSCSDMIIQSGIKKVVVGLVEEDVRIKGNGLKKLYKSGISVELVNNELYDELSEIVDNFKFVREKRLAD